MTRTKLRSGFQNTSREVLTANRTYYVRTDGNNNNTGLVNTAGGAFLTIQKAINLLSESIDFGGKTVTVQIGDGTYTNEVLIPSMTGGGVLVIQGNTTTPSNVLISTSASCFSITGALTTKTTLKAMKVTSSANDGVVNSGSGILYLDNMNFGLTSGWHLRCVSGVSIINCISNYTISGNAIGHYGIESGQIHATSITITLTGTPAFSFVFALVTRLALLAVYYSTFSGSATGSRYYIEANSVVHTAGAGLTFLPGNAAGTLTTGGQYI